MADKKISALTGATTPLAGTEVLPIVQSGSTVKVSVANLTAGRAIGMAGGSFTDNITQSTAAKGVNFTANTSAAGMTSQLLNWYEEGTWTPAIVSSSGTITSVTGNVGRYTRVGRSITCVFNFTIADNGTGAGVLFITGLPFVGSQAVLTYYAVFGWNRGTGMSLAGEYNPGTGGTGRIALYKYDATYPVATGNACECVVTYEV